MIRRGRAGGLAAKLVLRYGTAIEVDEKGLNRVTTAAYSAVNGFVGF